MAKYETIIATTLQEVLPFITQKMKGSSLTLSIVDESLLEYSSCKVLVRVYERYSMSGSNRLTMTLTLLEVENQVHCSVITGGGSQGMFFKVNTLGEHSFLSKMKEIIEEFKKLK